jgi:hypothetical protein
MYISRLNVPCLCNLAGPALPRSKSDREQVVVERRGRRELGTTTGLGRDPTTYRVLERYVRRGTQTAWLAYRRLSTDFAFRHGMGRIRCTCRTREKCMHDDHDDRRDGPEPCHRQSWRQAALSTTRSHSGSLGIIQRAFAVRIAVAYRRQLRNLPQKIAWIWHVPASMT